MTQSKYEELYHHGIKGQRWGIRRYQNEDGSLTPAGRKHLGLDHKGNISLTYDKMNKESAKKFVSKLLISAGAMGIAVYISKHPDLVEKGYNYFHNTKTTEDLIKESGPKIWSNKLGRYLSDEEIDDYFNNNYN